MRITTKDDLLKIRTAVQSSLYVPATLKMNIGMASCGIAAGAKEVYDKAREIFAEQNVLVARTGCLGLCEEEPLVDIQAPGQPRRRAVQFLVDIIGPTPDGLRQRQTWSADVQPAPGVKLVAPGINPHPHHAASDSAINAQPTVPYYEHGDGIFHVIAKTAAPIGR